MSGRVKTQAELEQERRDEELARQMQAQEQQRAQQQQVAPPRQQAAPGGTVTVLCPNCVATNHVDPTQRHLQHICGMCGQVLPMRTPDPESNVVPPGTATNPVSGYSAPAPSSSQLQANQQIRCHICGAINSVPHSNAQQFLCGSCRNILQATRPAPAPAAPQHLMVQQQQQMQVPVAIPLQQPNQVLVRCGTCPAINRVTGGPRTQFTCGSCGTLNQVPG